MNRLMISIRDPEYFVDEEHHSLPIIDDNENLTIKERNKSESSNATISSKVDITNTTNQQRFQKEDIERREEVPKPIDHSIIANEWEEDNNDYGANDDSFSACILWMDDNHRLEEWLAYHYYFLKLRYVVMNIDPFSRTSPKAIVDRWNDSENNYDLNMTIVTMTDSEYVENFDGEMEKIEIARNSTKDQEYKLGKAKTGYHRTRQHAFYKACSAHLVEQNKSWYERYCTFARFEGCVLLRGF